MLPAEMLHQIEEVNQTFRAGVMQPLRDVAGDLEPAGPTKRSRPGRHRAWRR